MSQILNENDDDNRSVAASDFVKLEQPDEVPDKQEKQQQGESQFESSDWALGTGNTRNYDNELKVQKLMIENLQANIQTLQEKVKNLELETKIRALEEKEEQKANFQTLETKFAQMFSTQSEKHQMEIAQLESKNLKLEEKLMSNVEVQTTKNGILDAKMEQLQDSKMLAEQQKKMMMAHFQGIVWDGSKTRASISECGLNATNASFEYGFAIATEGYAISGEHCRKENFQFPGTIVYYYEVTITSNRYWYSVGFTDESKPPAGRVGGSPHSYGIEAYDANKYGLWLSGKEHELECQIGPIARRYVVGSGLLLNSHNELAIFFTRNGILLGKQTPIKVNPTVGRLYPTVYNFYDSVEANFGDNLVAKPFKFDTDKFPGLVFE